MHQRDPQSLTASNKKNFLESHFGLKRRDLVPILIGTYPYSFNVIETGVVNSDSRRGREIWNKSSTVMSLLEMIRACMKTLKTGRIITPLKNFLITILRRFYLRPRGASATLEKDRTFDVDGIPPQHGPIRTKNGEPQHRNSTFRETAATRDPNRDLSQLALH